MRGSTNSATKGVLPMWCVAGHHVSICSTKTENARSRGTWTRTFLRTTASSVVFAMAISGGGIFGNGLKLVHGLLPHLCEMGAQTGNAFGGKAIVAAGSGLAVENQPGVFKHAQVLR